MLTGSLLPLKRKLPTQCASTRLTYGSPSGTARYGCRGGAAGCWAEPAGTVVAIDVEERPVAAKNEGSVATEGPADSSTSVQLAEGS